MSFEIINGSVTITLTTKKNKEIEIPIIEELDTEAPLCQIGDAKEIPPYFEGMKTITDFSELVNNLYGDGCGNTVLKEAHSKLSPDDEIREFTIEENVETEYEETICSVITFALPDFSVSINRTWRDDYNFQQQWVVYCLKPYDSSLDKQVTAKYDMTGKNAPTEKRKMGDKVYFLYCESSGLAVIYGSGKMWDILDGWESEGVLDDYEISELIIDSGVKNICYHLVYNSAKEIAKVIISDTVKKIDDEALEKYCVKKIVAPKDSAAEKYANDNNIAFEEMKVEESTGKKTSSKSTSQKSEKQAESKPTKKSTKASVPSKKSHKKLSEIISIDANDPNLVYVNNEWSFRLPKDVEYDVDCPFDGGFGVGVDLSSPQKAMVIKSKKNSCLNFALEEHFHLLGQYVTVEDCKYDDRSGDNTFTQKIVRDDGNFFVDIVVEANFLFGVDLRVRVRGKNVCPYNFFAVIKSEDENDHEMASKFINEIANSIEPISSTKTPIFVKAIDSEDDDAFDPVVAEQAKAEIIDQLEDIKKDMNSIGEQLQAMAEEAHKEEERLIASGEKRPFKHKVNDIVPKEFLDAIKVKETFGYSDMYYDELFDIYDKIIEISEADIDNIRWSVIYEVKDDINEIFDNLKKREYLHRFNHLVNSCEDSIIYTDEYDRINNDVAKLSDFDIKDGKLIKYNGKASFVDIPEGVIEITDGALYDKAYIAHVTIPESVEKIDDSIIAWTDCTEIFIPKKVKDIHEKAFSCCECLADIVVSEENEYYSAEDGVLYNKNKTELLFYSDGKKDKVYTIPKQVKKIGKSAFDKIYNNSSYPYRMLEKVIIPENVEIISEAAFAGLDNLKVVEIHNGVKNIEKDAFKNCAKLEEVYIPESVEKLLVSIFTGCKSLKKIYVSDKLSNPKVLENIEKIATKYNAKIIKTNIDEIINSNETSNSVTIDISNRDTTPAQNIKQPVVIESTKVFTEEEKDELMMKYFEGEDLTIEELNAIGANEDEEETQKSVAKSSSQARPIIEKAGEQQKKSGCYVATAVYGSYDCPEVWTLRRFRDYSLATTLFGRLFIMLYYAISPTLVKWFGDTKCFKRMWKSILDKMVEKLQNEGYESTPYEDKQY